MRIGIDGRFYNESGVGRYIRNLLSQLSEIDMKNEYIVYMLPKDYDSLSLPERFTKRKAAIQWHSVSEQFTFPKLLTKDHVDLMHFPYFSLPIWYKGPYVMTIHDLILHSFPTGKASTRSRIVYYSKWIGYRYIMQQAANNAQHILTVSNATKTDIENKLHVPNEKITVTYEGVDNAFQSSTEKSPIDGDYFLHVGNVYPHKNADRLVEAFSCALKQTKKPTKLVFAGRKDFFFERLADQIKVLGLEKQIEIRGSVSDAELSGLYEHAAATVVPSLMEGFGLPALEAMKKKSLVIASDIPVMREICKDAAIYAVPTSVYSLADALVRVANAKPQEFEEKKRLGLHRVGEFSWKEMAEKTLDVYESSNHL